MKNDFQMTNDLLDQIVGGSSSVELFPYSLSAAEGNEDKNCSTHCTTICVGVGSEYGTTSGTVYPTQPGANPER